MSKSARRAVSLNDPIATIDKEMDRAFSAMSEARTGSAWKGKVYRGTTQDAEWAKKNRIPSQFGVGRYWSPSKYVARTYGESVSSAAVVLENPYVFTLPGKRAYFEELLAKFGTRDPAKITAILKAKGHDGMIVRGVPVMRQGVAHPRSVEVIVF